MHRRALTGGRAAQAGAWSALLLRLAVVATGLVMLAVLAAGPRRLQGWLDAAPAWVAQQWRWIVMTLIAAGLIQVASRWVVRKRIGVVLIIAAILVAGAATAAVVYRTTPDVPDRAPSRSTQAVQSAALVAGLFGAAMTVWLSDQRRRNDHAELELSRDRDEEDRFTRAVELLGHKNAAVRVGAIHALHGLARTVPRRKQSVLDVLCAYIRQPFDHPGWGENHSLDGGTGTARIGTTRWNAHKHSRADRELEVRRTTLWLIGDLLPDRSEVPQVTYRVDLTGAHVDNLAFRWRALVLILDSAHVYGTGWMIGAQLCRGSSFHATHFHGKAWLDEAQFLGMSFDKTHFYQRASLDGADFGGRSSFREVVFHGDASLHDVHFDGDASFDDAEFHGNALISAAVFRGDASLERADFRADLVLNQTLFRQRLSLREAQVAQRTSLSQATFHGRIQFDGARFNGPTVLEAASFRRSAELSFFNTTFRGDLLLSPKAPLHNALGATVNPEQRVQLPDGWTYRVGAKPDHGDLVEISLAPRSVDPEPHDPYRE